MRYMRRGTTPRGTGRDNGWGRGGAPGGTRAAWHGRGGDEGAGIIEYSALICVAAVLLVALIVPLHGRITPYVRWGVCEVFTGFTGGHCKPPAEAAKKKTREKHTPCVVDTKTTTSGGE